MSHRRPRASSNPSHDALSGGFIPTSGLLSPPSSSQAASSVTSSLPTPRHHPLKPGSPKEAAFINYVDKGVQDVQRKFALRDVPGVLDEEGEERRRVLLSREGEGKGQKGRRQGYESFGEAARDLEKLVDVVWVSGTLSLQIPQLLSLALLTLTYIAAFPPTPRSLFRLLDKLDASFASLILGQDVQTGELLPSSQDIGRRSKVSGTEKVRIKSLVERTRVAVVEVMSGEVFDMEDQDDEEGSIKGGETGTEAEEMDVDEHGQRDLEGMVRDWEMEVARVYARTLNELGDELIGPHIGI